MNDLLYANSFIAAHSSKYMLTPVRIREMIGALNLNSALTVLEECGYELWNKPNATDDEIIDAERAKTLKTFLELCNDKNLAECIKAKFNFAMTDAGDAKYEELEKALYKTIAKHVGDIKSEEIKNYFLAELESFLQGQKRNEKQLFKLASENKTDLDSYNPLFYWYILKQTEFKVVKTILVGKRFDFPRERIYENLRGLHERFN